MKATMRMTMTGTAAAMRTDTLSHPMSSTDKVSDTPPRVTSTLEAVIFLQDSPPDSISTLALLLESTADRLSQFYLMSCCTAVFELFGIDLHYYRSEQLGTSVNDQVCF